jgi:TnpA family transposase
LESTKVCRGKLSFMPVLASVGCTTDSRGAYSALTPMIGGAVDFRIIGENWDETLRLAASIKAGTVAPSALMKRLAAYPKQNALAKTLREIGRLPHIIGVVAADAT